LVYYADAESL
jgi:hypothetical protein